MMTESGILTVDLGQRPEGTTLEDYLEEARLFALQIKLDREAHAKLMHEECTSSHEPYTPKDSAW